VRRFAPSHQRDGLDRGVTPYRPVSGLCREREPDQHRQRAPGFVLDGMFQVGDGPVKLPDETALRRRLHEEIDLSDMRLAPVDAVFRRYRATASRRLMAPAYRRRIPPERRCFPGP